MSLFELLDAVAKQLLAQPKPPETYWLRVVSFFVVSGAFGGVLAALRPYARRLGMRVNGDGSSDDSEKRLAVESNLRTVTSGEGHKGQTQVGTETTTTWLGGILYTQRQRPILVTASSASSPYWNPLICRLVIGALGGVGGAIAAMGILQVDKKFATVPKDDDILMFCAAGVVAGFVGYALLAKLSDKLMTDKEKRLLKEEVKKDANEAATNLVQIVDTKVEGKWKLARLHIAQSQGFAVANELDKDSDYAVTNKKVVEQATEALEAALMDFPSDRKAAIVLGRLYRRRYGDRVANLRLALKTLSDTLGHLQPTEETREDRADLLYNRACYYAELFKLRRDAGDKQAAMKDARESFDLLPDNAVFALDDEDFEPLRDDAEFAKWWFQKGLDLLTERIASLEALPVQSAEALGKKLYMRARFHAALYAHDPSDARKNSSFSDLDRALPFVQLSREVIARHFAPFSGDARFDGIKGKAGT